MDDVLKIVMDVSSAVSSSDTLETALHKLEGRYSTLGARMVKFGEDGSPVAATVEATTKAGEKQLVALKLLEEGWQEVRVTFQKAKEKAKDTTAELEKTNKSAEKFTKELVKGFTISQNAVNSFNMRTFQQNVHNAVLAASNDLVGVRNLINNLNSGNLISKGSPAVLNLQDMLRKGGAISVRGYGPEADITAINRITASQTLSPRRGGPGQVYTPRDDGPDYDFQSADRPVLGGGIDRRRQYTQMDLNGRGPFMPSNMGPQQSALEKLTDAASKNKTAADGLTLSWQNFGRYMLSHVAYQGVYTMIGALQSGFSAAMELSKAIATVRTLGPGSQGEWTDSAIKVSNAFGADPTEIAKGYYSALSNQIGNSVEEIERFTIATQKFALTTNSTAEEANNLFASIINTYGVSADSVGTLSAKLFKSIDLGRFVAKDFANSIGRVIVPAQQLGISIDQVLGALAILTQKGVKPSDAMTQLLNLFNKLVKPSQELKKEFASWGYSSAQAAVQMEGFVGVLTRLENVLKVEGLSQLAKEFNDLRGFRGVLGLVNNIELLNTAITEIGSASEQTAEALKTKLEDPAKSLEIQMQRTKNIFIGFFTDLLKPLDNTLKLFGGFDQIMKALLPALTAAGSLAGFAGIAFALKNVWSILMSVNPYLRAAAIAITGISTAMSFMRTEADKLAEALAAATPVNLPDTLDTMIKLSNAQAEASVKTRRQMLAYTEANLAAANYYDRLNKLEGDYRIALQETTDKVTDAFASRLAVATEAMSKAKSDLAATKSMLEQVQKASGKDTIESITSGKTQDVQYTALLNKSQELALEFGNASKQRQQIILTEINAITSKLTALKSEAASFSKESKDIEMAKKRETLTLRKEELEYALKTLELQNQVGRENAPKGKKFKGLSTSGIEAELLKVNKDIDALDAQQRQTKLDKLAEENKKIEANKVIYENVTNLAGIQLDINNQLLETLTRQAAEEERIAAAKREEVANLKLAKDAYSDSLRVIKEIEVASNGANYFNNEDAAQRDKLRASNAIDEVITYFNLIGETLKPSDLSVLIGLVIKLTAGQAARQSELAKEALERNRAVSEKKRQDLILESTNAREAAKAKVADARGGIAALGLEQYTSKEDVLEKLKEVSADPRGVRLKAGGDLFGASTVAEGKYSDAQQDAMKGALAQLYVALKAEEEATNKLAEIQSNTTINLEPGITALTVSNGKLQKAIEDLTARMSPDVKAMGGRGSDTIPTMLAPGEFVVNSTSAARWRTQLMAMNNGTHMASGGPVSNVNVGDINISMSSQGNAQADVIAIGHALRREIRRGTVKL